jgi:transcriptional regulator with XRE-family HTH domain
MTLYEKLQTLCKNRGFEISNLGGVLGINLSKGTISKWKKGAMPRAATLKAIADYFGVSVPYLMGEEIIETKNSVEKTSEGDEVIIFHRNGKTESRRFTKEQMEVLYSMMDIMNASEKDTQK